MADATITGSLLDAIGDAYDFRGAKIWLIFNTANKRVTAADGTVRTGAGAATVNADGTFSLAGVPVPSAGSNPVSFQVMVCYEVPPRLPYQRKVTRERGNFGWMTVTTSADIKDLEAEQYAPPEYLTVLTEQLDEKIAEAEEERQGAEDARDLAEQYRDEAHDISNIDTSDDVVEVLIKPGAAGPKTKAALTASIAAVVAWAKNPDSLITGAVTRNGDGVVTSAVVKWPDGVAGVFTTDTIGALNTIDAYHVTRVGSPTKTYTQPTITRDTNGAATDVPAIVVT